MMVPNGLHVSRAVFIDVGRMPVLGEVVLLHIKGLVQAEAVSDESAPSR